MIIKVINEVYFEMICVHKNTKKVNLSHAISLRRTPITVEQVVVYDGDVSVQPIGIKRIHGKRVTFDKVIHAPARIFVTYGSLQIYKDHDN
nr:MAG TPA: hypothetical protein [Caudoviricetes sp.]